MYKLRGSLKQRLRYVSSHVLDSIVLVGSFGTVGTSFHSKAVFKQAKEELANKSEKVDDLIKAIRKN